MTIRAHALSPLLAFALAATLGAAPAMATPAAVAEAKPPVTAVALDAEALWKQGRDAADHGALDEAVGFYRQSLAVDPQGRAAMVDLATALTDLGRFDDAQRTYERAVKLYPHDAVALNGLGYVHFRQDRFEAAIACYRRALARMDDPQFHLNLGLALLGQERFGQAEDEFRKALALAPDHYWATNNLGYALQRQGRGGEAETAYARALRLGPPDLTTHYNAGRLLMDQERFEEASWVYTDALRRDGGSVEALAGLAHGLARQGRLPEALREAAMAVRLGPSYAAGWFALAEARYLGGDRRGGIEAGLQAVKLNPRSPVYQLALGKMLDQQSRFTEALAAYQTFLALAPNDQEAPWARMMVRLLSER
jgi:tetratricopeptide (TPR) repeat protein